MRPKYSHHFSGRGGGVILINKVDRIRDTGAKGKTLAVRDSLRNRLAPLLPPTGPRYWYDTPWREYAGIYRNKVRQPGTGEMGVEVNAGSTNFAPSMIVPRAIKRIVD